MNLKTMAAATLILAGTGLTALAPTALHADPRDGSQLSATTVEHGTDDYYHIKYNGGQEGDVHVVANNDGDDQYLEIKVYDPDGNLVARDHGGFNHSPQCGFHVDSQWQWRQYTIKVVNLSYHSIPYAIHFF